LWYETNKPRILEQKKEYRQSNKVYTSENGNNYYQENIVLIKQKSKRCREENKEKDRGREKKKHNL
jgi:hypothetical protein